MSRSAGRSAVAAAAYRMGTRLHDERADLTHDYTRRSGVLRSFVVAPDDAPSWAHAPEALWNAAEASEKRKNSVVAREAELALPAAVSSAEREGIARAFAEELVERYRVAVTVAIHEPSRLGDDRNFHAHIMWTTRELGPEGLGSKTRVLDDVRNTGPAEIIYLRQYAADMINDALERAGVDERVDARSYKDRGIAREPTTHLGPAATEMERKGKGSEKGEKNRDTEERNTQHQELTEQLAALEATIAAIEAELGEEDRTHDAPGVEEGREPAHERPDTDQGRKDFAALAAEEQAELERYAAPFKRAIEETGQVHQIDGLSFWERAVTVLATWRDTAVGWARSGWQRILEAWEGPDDPEPDGPDMER